MTRQITIYLDDKDMEHLEAAAEADSRHPREQAKYYILGVLSGLPTLEQRVAWTETNVKRLLLHLHMLSDIEE